MSALQTFIAARTPAGWETRPLWSLFRRQKLTGYADEELLSVYRDYGVIPKSSRDDNHNKESDDLSGYQLVTEGSLVTNKMKAWQGSIAISRYRGIVSPAYYVYKPLSEEADQFLHYLLRSEPYIALYGRISKGVRVNQWDLEHEALRNVPVMLPDLETQKAIADFLDRETARINALVKKKRKLFDLIEEKRAVELNALLLGGEVYSPGEKPSHLFWLNRLPRGWKAMPLKFLGRENEPCVQMGPFGGMLTQVSSKKTPYKLYGQENTISKDFSRGRRWIDPLVFESLCKYEILPGDLVLTRKGSIGNCAIFPEGASQGIADSDTIRVRLNSSVISAWFAQTCLQSAIYIRDQLEFTKRGAVLSGLNTSVVGNLKIALPPLSTQHAIENSARDVLVPLIKISEGVASSIDRLNEFRSALITGAVTGQIDVETWGKEGKTDRRLDQIEEDLALREARA